MSRAAGTPGAPPPAAGEAARATSRGPGLRVERDGRHATVTLDRPPLNVLDLATLEHLDEALAELALGETEKGDEEETGGPLQTLVVTGGAEVFSAGVAVEDHVPERLGAMLEIFHGALTRLEDLPAITIAAVSGHCLGGGMELAIACDLVVADETARLGQPEIRLGCYPPFAAALLPRRIGPGRTLDLLATGRVLPAREAAEWGLVHRVTPAGELEAGVRELVERLGGHSAAVTRLVKKAVRVGGERDFPEALAASERIYRDELTALEDMTEGLAAFLDKREPRWRHR